MRRECLRCGERFTVFVERDRECVECRMRGGDHDDDRDERTKARARQLRAVLARKRGTS